MLIELLSLRVTAEVLQVNIDRHFEGVAGASIFDR